ncbi:hypothetical protein JOF56_002781 [Kibdelosporangium banguiense]|uniref:Uncharacterized protein n=1 Tax=Kibdelosporangium banguiense TaxID=1365924 RepID=A0ABS4TD98_9PSEU|nr:hypothetical protein [Kibdelosporangium banguiense]
MPKRALNRGHRCRVHRREVRTTRLIQVMLFVVGQVIHYLFR